jgi:hypothetical protein
MSLRSEILFLTNTQVNGINYNIKRAAPPKKYALCVVFWILTFTHVNMEKLPCNFGVIAM